MKQPRRDSHSHADNHDTVEHVMEETGLSDERDNPGMLRDGPVRSGIDPRRKPRDS